MKTLAELSDGVRPTLPSEERVVENWRNAEIRKAHERMVRAAETVSLAWDEYVGTEDHEPEDEGGGFDLVVEAITELREATDAWKALDG